MDTEKVVVVLLVISIVLSALSLVTTLTLNSDISGFSFPRVTATNTLTNVAGPSGSSVGVTILPVGSGK